MPVYTLTGWWAVLVVLVGFVAVLWLCRRFPNQFGMVLWAKRRDESDSKHTSKDDPGCR
jgi:hypothetical protein